MKNDVRFDLTDLELTNAPLVIPLSMGWLTTLDATDVTAQGFTGRCANWSGGQHNGSVRYLVIMNG